MKDSVLSTHSSGRIPLLLIHGIVCDHTWFDPLLPCLQDVFAPVAYDRRGYGLPAQTVTDHSVEAQLADALRAIQDKPDRFYVLGHSAGCNTAVELALRYPEKVKGVLLYEPAFGLLEEDQKRLDAWRAEVEHYAEGRRLGKILQSFQETAGMERRSTPVSKDSLQRALQNLENYAYGELHAIRAYKPDPKTIAASEVPMAIAVSELGKNTLFGQISMHDAKTLQLPVHWFPGGHSGLIEYPAASADLIKSIVFEMEERP